MPQQVDDVVLKTVDVAQKDDDDDAQVDDEEEAQQDASSLGASGSSRVYLRGLTSLLSDRYLVRDAR
jgi:hypothetical protein